MEPEREIFAVYSDGGVIQKNPSDIGGTWAFVQVDGDGQVIAERSGVIPADDTYGARVLAGRVTNNLTEFVALLKAVESLPAGFSGVIASDSEITIGRFFRDSPCAGIPEHMERRMRAAVARLGEPNVIRLKGHPSRADLAAGFKDGAPVSPFNVRCDQLCNLAGLDYLIQTGRVARTNRKGNKGDV